MQKALQMEIFKVMDKKNGYVKNNKIKYKIIAIDYGMKNQLRCFSDINCGVTVVPANFSEEILKLNHMGFFIEWSRRSCGDWEICNTNCKKIN